MAAIEVDELRRVYRTRNGPRRSITVEAVANISFSVEHGELFGLLGPNGAGKTTTIKMLVTLLQPTSGTARILGFDVARQKRQVRTQVGYVFGGDRGLYLRVSARDNLRYFADLYGVSWRDQKRRVDEVLELAGLRGRDRERVEGYSRGMRQRLHVARGLLHDPPVVFLDEPTIGVDPVGARELRAVIASLTEAGKSVLLTTHYMLEADALCDRIAVIKDGRIVGEGTPAQLKQSAAGLHVLEIEAYGVPEDRIGRVRTIPAVHSVSVENREHLQVLQVRSKQGGEIAATVLSRLDGVRLGRVSVREPTLEDAYVALVSTGRVGAGRVSTGRVGAGRVGAGP